MTRLFISYAHEDRRLLQNFLKHLRPVLDAQAKGAPVEIWFDDELRGGEAWNDRIAEAIDKADAFILFVSAEFLASTFIMDRELTAILTARDTRQALVVPVIARQCHWETRLGHLQAVPHDDKNRLKPIGGWRPANDGHHAASGQFGEALERKREETNSNHNRVGTVPIPNDFSGREPIEQWLETHSREKIILFAERSALRIAPQGMRLLDAKFQVTEQEKGSNLILALFRALVVPWVIAKYSRLQLDYIDVPHPLFRLL